MLKDCNPEDLEKIIQKNPITQKDIIDIMLTKVGEIKLTSAIVITSVFYNKHTGKYEIDFSQQEIEKSPEIIAQSLIHKLYHIHCGVSSIMNYETTLQKSMRIEGVINNASREFYSKNREFCENLYKEIHDKYLKK